MTLNRIMRMCRMASPPEAKGTILNKEVIEYGRTCNRLH